MPPDLLAQMYPRLPEFRALRAGLDPDGMLAFDLSRRLGLPAGRQADRRPPFPATR